MSENFKDDEDLATEAFSNGEYERCIYFCNRMIESSSCPYAMNSYIVRSLICQGRIPEAMNSVKFIGGPFYWYSVLFELRRYFESISDHHLLHNIQDIMDLFQFDIKNCCFRGDLDLMNTFHGRFYIKYIESDLVLYRYHDDLNLRGAKCSFLTDTATWNECKTKEDIRNKLSIKSEWNELKYVTKIVVSPPAFIVFGPSAAIDSYDGFGTQYIVPKSVPIRRVLMEVL